jgi:protein CpxP
MNRTMFRKPMLQAAMLALCTTLLGTVPMLAQDNTATPPSPPSPPQQMGPMGGRGGRMGGRQLEMLTSRLSLTPDQVAQVKAINEDTMKQAMAVRNDTSIAMADKRSKMMEIRKASQDKIRALLNDDQKTKYDALRAEMRERMMNRGAGPGMPPGAPPPPPAAPKQ